MNIFHSECVFNLFGTFLDKIYNDKYGPTLYMLISHLSVNLQYWLTFHKSLTEIRPLLALCQNH